MLWAKLCCNPQNQKTVIATNCSHNHNCESSECKSKGEMNYYKRRVQFLTTSVAIAGETFERYALLLAMPEKWTSFSKTTEKDVLHSFNKSAEKRIWDHFNPQWVAQFCTNLRICTVVAQKRKTYKLMVEMMKEETNPDNVLILAVFEKAELNTFRKHSSKQKSRAVISTRHNLFIRKTLSSVRKLVAIAWKQFEGSVVGKWMKLQYIREKLLRKSQKKYAKAPKHLWNTKCCAIS